MKLKSFGCSFIFGTDLADSNDGSTCLTITPSLSTWPACLARHMGYDYECYAWAGIGNLQILEQILNQASSDPALFVISWSWIDRFDYVQDLNRQWKTIRPTNNNQPAEYYYRHLHSQYRDKLTTLTGIKLAIDTLAQRGHRVIMTYMDDLIFETQWHTSPAVLDLQNYIRPHMTTFAGKTFLQWAQLNQYHINECMHPMEDAHASAAQYLIDYGLL